jgi:beta-galactosidase
LNQPILIFSTVILSKKCPFLVRTRMFALLFCCACMGGPGASAQQSTRLTGNWEFLRQDLGGIWEAVRPYGKGDPGSVPVWQAVQLPHCVNALDAVDPIGNYYRGPAWYRTQLTMNNPYPNGRTLLHFEGAGQKSEVYVYMTKVGSHTGGYDEWSVDITEAAAAFAQTDVCKKQFKGRIPISIRTDNSRDLEMIPSGQSDFNIYGGIYRYLNLVYTPAISIDQVFARTELDKSGKEGIVHIRARFYNPAVINASGSTNSDSPDKATVYIGLTDPDGRSVRQKNNNNSSISISIPKSSGSPTDAGDSLSDIIVKMPGQWSPDHPALYTLAVSINSPAGTCTYTTKIGFRNFTFADNGPFYLNGQRLLLRGTHRHEDHAGLGAAMTEDLMRREMILMKEMGVNFIRLAHYQQSPIILNLCDSLGILVWEEIPWCRGGLGGKIYKDQARRMLTHMIRQHYDHPAVIIWGLGNENDWPGDFPQFDKDSIRLFMQELNDLAHHLDPWRMTAIRRCDFCKDIPDVYSPSIWAGWYRGIYTEYKQSTEEEFKKVKHFLHVEWGGDSHARRHSENPDKALLAVSAGKGTDERAGDASLFGGAARVSKDGDWSESYICNLVDWHLKEQETMPWLTGTAQWVFKDFSTPLRPDNPVPFVNQKGVVERDLTIKEVYYVFQSYWTDKLMAHIYGHSWPVRWGGEGEEKLVKVYSNCEEATLFLNGLSYGPKKRNSQDFPAAGLRWKLTFNKGENRIRVIARRGQVIVEDSIRFQYQTTQWGKAAKMTIERIGQTDSTITIRVQLLDEHGVACLDAADWIRFGLTGDGKLIDDQGTSTGSRLVQAFNGQAIISLTTRGGHSVVSAQSGELNTVFITL